MNKSNIKIRFFTSLIFTIALVVCAFSQLEDTSRVQSYYELGKSFFPDAVDSTEYYFEKGLVLAKKIDYIQGQVNILRSRGAVRGFSGRNEEGAKDLVTAIAIVEEHGLPVVEKVNCLINLGSGYLRAGDETSALTAYTEAEELTRTYNLPNKRALLLNNIAIIYKRGERFDHAIEIYGQSEELRIDQKDSSGLANVYFNMAGCYAEMNDPESQLEYSRRAKDLYQSLGQEDDVILTESVYGEALIKMGRSREGVAILDKLDLSNVQLYDASVKLYYAKGLSDLGRITDSQSELQQIKDDLLDSEFEGFKAFWYRLTSNNESKLKNYNKAYVALDSFVSHQERLTILERTKVRTEMEEKYLSTQKDLELEIRERQLKSAKRNRALLIGGLCALALLSYQQYRTSRFRKAANAELNKKNAIIKKALSDKELLLKEIHHRVKNNLQFISALLGLQTDHVSDQTALDALQEGQDRVQSMALIHQDLYQRDDLKSVNMKEYFVKLIEGLFDSYNIRSESISLQLNIDELNLDVDSVIPIGLIVNELISNSLKYAFEEGTKGQIIVSLREDNNQLQLIVADNGIGMKDVSKNNLGKSLGYKLIIALTEQLEGSMAIDNKDGTKVSLFFKKYQKSLLNM